MTTENTPKPTFKAPTPPPQFKRTPDVPQMSAYVPSLKTPSQDKAAEKLPQNPPEIKSSFTTSVNSSLSSSKGIYDDNFAAQFNLPPVLLTTKVIGAIFAGIFLFGIIFGATVFGSTTKTTTSGLQGVVRNPEVRAGRQRCGIAEKTQGCVLFIMNATRRDREARSFYDEAARITGVPSYTIELGNIEYATSIIRPGFIAQINIPPANR